MSPSDLRAQLEEDLLWRLDELHLIRNQLVNIADEEDRRRYRKTLVVMLYSHFEGFCKLAFSTYAQAVNNERLICQEANSFITAATLDDVFRALLDTNKKCDLFRRELPHDAPLHRYARQVDFVDAIRDIDSRLVVLPVDEIVDVESNLKPIVLRKILFRLGFPPETFAAHEGVIHRLLNRRNNIAHGVERGGIDEAEYQSLEKVTTVLMTSVMAEITRALAERRFVRAQNGSMI